MDFHLAWHSHTITLLHRILKCVGHIDRRRDTNGTDRTRSQVWIKESICLCVLQIKISGPSKICGVFYNLKHSRLRICYLSCVGYAKAFRSFKLFANIRVNTLRYSDIDLHLRIVGCLLRDIEGKDMARILLSLIAPIEKCWVEAELNCMMEIKEGSLLHGVLVRILRAWTK